MNDLAAAHYTVPTSAKYSAAHSSPLGSLSAGLATNSQGTLFSRILQVAMGLFVTTMELPSLPQEMSASPLISFDCDFSRPCRWNSIGSAPDRWRLAKGEPDSLLWLAATGTMVLPQEPYTLIEVRGGTRADALTSEVIGCQREASLFSFTYWTMGMSDLEICLLDLQYRSFNCTGLLQSHIQPGKVSLKVPPSRHPFHIAITPSTEQGIIIIDDIKYDAKYCGLPPPVIQPLPIFPTTPPQLPSVPTLPTLPMPQPVPVVEAFTMPTGALTFLPPIPIVQTPPSATISSVTAHPPPQSASLPPSFVTTQHPAPPPQQTQRPDLWPIEITGPKITYAPMTTTTRYFPPTSTYAPVRPYPLNTVFPNVVSTTPVFDLLIVGSKTSILSDRRRGRIVDDTSDLLCDFANNFPCYWGPEAGKWAVIEKGAIPSMEEEAEENNIELPAFPAALVIQSTAMLSSDPLRCQTGLGRLLLRYWTNGRVLLQVCAIGYASDSTKIQCVEEVAHKSALDDTTLAVFELANSISDPFTLSIIPVWERGSRNSSNTYLVIDEIAYMGNCTEASGAESAKTEEMKGNAGPAITINPDTIPLIFTARPKRPRITTPPPTPPNMKPKSRPIPIIHPVLVTNNISGPPAVASVPEERSKGTRYPYSTTGKTFTTPSSSGEVEGTPNMGTDKGDVNKLSPVGSQGTSHNTTEQGSSYSIPFTTTQHTLLTTNDPELDYCKLLNCDFNVDACLYLNHGLTKLPWTLRTKGYGFPLSRHTDIRPASSNVQFISTVLGPGDFAILESPRFNLTTGINVLLFQYYRPTHSSTIRLCLGTKYSRPMRTVHAFLQCPPILRSLTSKNAFRWNSVHIQLPPGTNHFYLVAHNLDRSTEHTAIAIDNIRVAICDPRNHLDQGESKEGSYNEGEEEE